MDTTKAITHIGLCAGYGGIELGLHRAIPNLRSVALCEIEAFAIANLVSKMEAGLLDPAPLWTNLKTFPWSDFHDCVDVLSGGYPCQPFSAAGKRLGADDPRHLWPYISAGIAAMRPSLCFFENVEGHISLGLPDVIEDLAGLGYRTTWGIFSASEVGAVHQRKSVFILAHRQCAGLERFHYRDTPAVTPKNWRTDLGASGQRDAWPSRPGQRQHDWEPPRVVGNAAQRDERGQQGCGMATGQETSGQRAGDYDIAYGSSEDCAAMAHHHGPHAGHGEQRPERTSRDLSGGCREDLGNTESQRPAAQRAEHEGFGGQLCAASASSQGAMGHANSTRPQERPRQRGSAIQGVDADGGETAERQTQPTLGRDTDGLTHRLDDAVLHVSTDNRTDELRLLGNGVVPATAERAFRVLLAELT